MGVLPYRTNATDLSDDELILFDTFWYGGTQFRLLCGEFFHEQWNLGYKHSLSDKELRITVRSLFDRGLVRLWKSLQGERMQVDIQLTQLGGEMWAAERCPVWHCWAGTSYRTTRRGEYVLQLRALSQDTLQNLIDTGTEARFWDLRGSRIRFRKVAHYRLVPWAPASELHVMYAIGAPEEAGLACDCDWQLMEEKRNFWQDVPGLQKMLRDNNR